MSGRDGTNLKKSDKGANRRREFTYEGPQPERQELIAAARELAEDCGLTLWACGSGSEGLAQQVIRQIERFTPRQLRGLFAIFGQGAVYFNGLRWDSHRPYGDEDVAGESALEAKALARAIRRSIEPRKRCAA